MRNVRNITVAVTPELYRQTRRLAADYDTTVTEIVAYLLERLPDALKRAGYPVGGPNAAPTPSTHSKTIPYGPIRQGSDRSVPEVTPPPPPKTENSGCTPVRTKLNASISEIYKEILGADTAPVRQYEYANSHILSDLEEASKQHAATVRQYLAGDLEG